MMVFSLPAPRFKRSEPTQHRYYRHSRSAQPASRPAWTMHRPAARGVAMAPTVQEILADAVAHWLGTSLSTGSEMLPPLAAARGRTWAIRRSAAARGGS